MKRLDVIGIHLNKEVSDACFGIFAKISTDDSLIPCYVIPTDEELMIARDAYELV